MKILMGAEDKSDGKSSLASYFSMPCALLRMIFRFPILSLALQIGGNWQSPNPPSEFGFSSKSSDPDGAEQRFAGRST